MITNMRLKVLFLAVSFSTVGLPAYAIDSSMKQQLLRLDPQTRLEQLCDHETMTSIRTDRNSYSPDKVVAYTFSEPVLSDKTMEAPGAVFRSRGDWYRLSFRCKADVEQVEVRSLRYEIGKKVPREKWIRYNLYD